MDNTEQISCVASRGMHSPHKLGPRTCILDVDETLVHTWDNTSFVSTYGIYTNPTLFRRFHPIGEPPLAYSIKFNDTNGENHAWGLYRPHLQTFLKFCDEYFDDILIWSAGVPDYVNNVIKHMYHDLGLRLPKLVWARPKCSSYKGMYHKPIGDIITDINSRPLSQLCIDPKSTIIVDDRNHTFMSNPQNGVLIPIYHPGKDRYNRIPTIEDLLDRSDNNLIRLMSWLQTSMIRNAEDIRYVDKSTIFY